MASKPIFKSAYYFGEEKYNTPTGGPMEEVYEYEIDDFGRKILVKTGETNRWQKIQEMQEETTLKVILAKCAAGDTSALRPGGQYMDTVNMPKDFIEARKMMQNLENMWNKLDKEIKEKYNYDLDEFMAASGSDEWLMDMGLIEKPAEETSPINDTQSKEGGSDE